MNKNTPQPLKKKRQTPQKADVPAGPNSIQPKNRLLSLDVMRGLVMILLAGESCLLYVSLRDLQPNGTSAFLVDQIFQHHPWNGLHMWDLIQPAFMLMAGTALYISYH